MSLFISPELANIPRVPRISQALGDFKPAPLILLYLLTQKSFAILISRVNLMGFWRKTAFSSSHKHSTRLSFDDDVDFTSQTCHQLTCSFWGHKRPSQFPPWTEGPPSCLQVTSATGRAGGNELCCSSLQREKRGLSNSTKFTADSPHQGLPFSPNQPCRHIFQLHLCSCQPLPASCQAPISTFIYYPCRLVRKQNSPPPQKPCSVQFSRSVVSKSFRPMDCSMPGFPVHHQLPELAQTQVHWVGDTTQPSHPLLSPSPLTFKKRTILPTWKSEVIRNLQLSFLLLLLLSRFSLDGSLPGSSVPGILQARTLEWVAISFSNYPFCTSLYMLLLRQTALYWRQVPVCFLGSPGLEFISSRIPSLILRSSDLTYVLCSLNQCSRHSLCFISSLICGCSVCFGPHCTACGILVLWPGIEPKPLAVRVHRLD